MLEELGGHLEAMRDLVGGLEPERLCPDDARRLLELAAATERLGLGLKLAVAPPRRRRPIPPPSHPPTGTIEPSTTYRA